jgi:CRP-like cAMP-binding protein/Fe-S-cluster-containing hydrogenase component 2
MTQTIDVGALLGEFELFEDTKKGDLKKLNDESRCQLERHAAGEAIVRQGELDTEFYVVIEGIASAYRQEGEGDTRLLGSFVAGSWFGEMSAISHQARSATVIADTPCSVARIDSQLFAALFKDKKSKFRTLIDERYRTYALELHLRTAPLFQGFSPGFLQDVSTVCELVSFEKDAAIATQGQPADAVYLIRSGIVQRSAVMPDGSIKLQEYLRENSSFGEGCVLGEAWNSTFTTLSQVDVVKISREAFATIFNRSGDAMKTRMMTQAQFIVNEGHLKPDTQIDPAQLDHLLHHETAKGHEALVIDLKKCTRCNACVESCVSVHDDRIPRLSKRGIKVGDDQMLSSACYNCKIPECMISCPYGAIRRDVDGQVHVITNNCVGCAQCESACPYGVIRMADPEGGGINEEDPLAFLKSIPFLNRIIGRMPTVAVEDDDGGKKTKKKPQMLAVKCDLCAGLPFEACVYNCPCGAILRKSPERLQGSDAISM